jgi:hypothetical protein
MVEAMTPIGPRETQPEVYVFGIFFYQAQTQDVKG